MFNKEKVTNSNEDFLYQKIQKILKLQFSKISAKELKMTQTTRAIIQEGEINNFSAAVKYILFIQVDTVLLVKVA